MTTRSFNDRVWVNTITVVLLGLAAISLYPLLYVLAESFSSDVAVQRGQVVLWPVDFNVESWVRVFANGDIFGPIRISLFTTVVGTALSMMATILLAYPTSKQSFPLTPAISLMVVFTMILNTPMIPYFLTLRSYGLINNVWVLILPHMVIPFNYFVLRTFFRQTPDSLEESAFIDGAGYYQILFRIVLPVSKAALATIGLFYAVLIWNQFFHPKLFIYDDALYTAQIYLRNVLDQSSSLDSEAASFAEAGTTSGPLTLGAVAVVVLTLPIIAVYPFIQKHFVKGATLGAIKG